MRRHQENVYRAFLMNNFSNHSIIFTASKKDAFDLFGRESFSGTPISRAWIEPCDTIDNQPLKVFIGSEDEER